MVRAFGPHPLAVTKSLSGASSILTLPSTPSHRGQVGRVILMIRSTYWWSGGMLSAVFSHSFKGRSLSPSPTCSDKSLQPLQQYHPRRRRGGFSLRPSTSPVLRSPGYDRSRLSSRKSPSFYRARCLVLPSSRGRQKSRFKDSRWVFGSLMLSPAKEGGVFGGKRPDQSAAGVVVKSINSSSSTYSPPFSVITPNG